MATTFAALTGRFGDTQYFVLTMKAGDLVRLTTFRSKTKKDNQLDEMPLEERDQRDIRFDYVKNKIAPYLTENKKDRFFGAVIMAVENFHPTKFLPFEKIVDHKNIPEFFEGMLETEIGQMGFLRLTGGEVFRPLDGQHRIKALDFAISGKDENGKGIKHIDADRSLADEQVTVILVEYENKKARKIFTKVNRYATKTNTGQNLVTDDEDTIAILSRRIANDMSIIGPDLVNYKSNTLPPKSIYFTTLATIADCNRVIIDTSFGGGDIEPNLPLNNRSLFKQYEQEVIKVWKFLVENIVLFADALVDKGESGHIKRQEIREDYLLGKPAAQLYLVSAFIRLVEQSDFGKQEAALKLNQINWRIKNDEVWDRLLMSGGRIQTKNKTLAIKIIYYMAGGKMEDNEKEDLRKEYAALFPGGEREDKQLPPYSPHPIQHDLP